MVAAIDLANPCLLISKSETAHSEITVEEVGTAKKAGTDDFSLDFLAVASISDGERGTAMVLKLQMSNEIISDLIARHERQVAQLQSLVANGDGDPDAYFRVLMTLEAGLQDIRQGLLAAAYVAIASLANEKSAGIGAAAVTARARQHFRKG